MSAIPYIYYCLIVLYLFIVCIINLLPTKVCNCRFLVAGTVGEPGLGTGDLDSSALEHVELAGQGGHQVGLRPGEQGKPILVAKAPIRVWQKPESSVPPLYRVF